MGYDFNAAIFWKYVPKLWAAAGATLWVAVAAIALASGVGLLVATAKLSKWRVVRAIGIVYTEFWRGTPLLVQLLWLYFGIPLVLGVTISAELAAVLALGLWSGAHVTEIFRGGIQSIEDTQHYAGYSLGMTPLQVAWRVVLPQTARRILPPFISQFVVTVKYSALVSVVGVVEITKRAEMAVVSTFRPLEIYLAAALVYFVLLFVISRTGKLLEKALRVDALTGQ